jgi:SRSO17 transposase
LVACFVAPSRAERCSPPKGETGLDHCEARCWHGWPRLMTLAMLGLAFLKPGPTTPPTKNGPVNYKL